MLFKQYRVLGIDPKEASNRALCKGEVGCGEFREPLVTTILDPKGAFNLLQIPTTIKGDIRENTEHH